MGIGAVLLQKEKPIAYYSKKLPQHLRKASAYVRELSAVVESVKKWLLGTHFIIRTDHRSLKEILTQVIQTPEQQKYLSKLMGYDYTITYKPGCDNAVADALSRQGDDYNCYFGISAPSFTFLDDLKKEYLTLPAYQKLLSDMNKGQQLKWPLQFKNGFTYYGSRLFLVYQSHMISFLLQEFHCAPSSGHFGVLKTFKRLANNFF